MNNLQTLQKQLAEIKRQIRLHKKEAVEGIGKRLTDARKEKGMTQEELAELLGLTRVQVTNIETRGGITLENFLMACEVLGKTPNELSGFHT